MPLPPPERLLTSTARSTFESLALLYAEPTPAPGDPLGALDTLGPLDAFGAPPGDALDLAFGGSAVCACVAFAGVARGEAVEGVLAVCVTAGVAAALTENMLGVGAAGRAERRDAVGEFANVVCGHVLSAAAGPDAVFCLAAPACADGAPIDGAPIDGAPVSDAPPDPDTATWRVWLAVEGGRACVTLHASAVLFAAAPADVPAGTAA